MEARRPPDRVTRVLWLDPAPDSLAVVPCAGRIVGVGAVLPGVAIEHTLREAFAEETSGGPEGYIGPVAHVLDVKHRGHNVLEGPLFRAVCEPTRNLVIHYRVERDDAIHVHCSRPGTRVWVLLEEA